MSGTPDAVMRSLGSRLIEKFLRLAEHTKRFPVDVMEDGAAQDHAHEPVHRGEQLTSARNGVLGIALER